MNKNLPKKAKDIKGKVAIAELRRAHWIIVLLALSFALILLFVGTCQVELDAALSIVAACLLILVGAISLATIYALDKR